MGHKFEALQIFFVCSTPCSAISELHFLVRSTSKFDEIVKAVFLEFDVNFFKVNYDSSALWSDYVNMEVQVIVIISWVTWCRQQTCKYINLTLLKVRCAIRDVMIMSFLNESFNITVLLKFSMLMHSYTIWSTMFLSKFFV